MIKKHLYLQICGLFIFSLLVFALLASVAWIIIDRDQADSDLFRKSAALTEMLLPPIGASSTIQKSTLNELHQALDFDLSLYTSDGLLLVYSGTLVELPDITKSPILSTWQQSAGGTHWVTQLKDGRYLVINVERFQLPGESAVFVIFLLVIAVGIAAIMYPFIRHLTGRLERLQLGVKQIGAGHLDARVKVEGKDEIAQVALSFNEAAERIQSLVNAQRLLLANASHELRTPLSRIRLGIEMLERQGTPARIKALQVDITELDILIEELTMMTLIDEGVGKRDFEQFDLMGLLAEECARYQACELVGHSVCINGDRRMIQRAIRNLLDNGMKHGKPPILVQLESDDNHTLVSVCDEGTGISDVEKNKILEPFQRGSGKQNTPGSGLGLTLVKKVMDAHQGTIEVRNKPTSKIILRF